MILYGQFIHEWEFNVLYKRIRSYQQDNYAKNILERLFDFMKVVGMNFELVVGFVIDNQNEN